MTEVALAAPVVGYDESGNTGVDLLNRDQPVYTLASVHVDEETLASVMPETGLDEFHFVRQRRSAAGRRAILRVLNSPELSGESVRVVVIHKPFMISAKMIDLLVEPALAESGVDMYAAGQHLAAANLLHGVVGVLDPEGFSELQRAFLDLLRETPGAREAFVDNLDGIGAGQGRQQSGLFDVMRQGVQRDDLVVEDLSTLDPAIPALNALAHEWSRSIGEHTILHDRQDTLRRWIPALSRYWATQEMDATLWNGAELQYPLTIGQFTFAESQDSLLIQLADIVAGAAMTLTRHLASKDAEKDRFVERLDATPLRSWFVDASIWPSLASLEEQSGSHPSTTPWVFGRPGSR